MKAYETRGTKKGRIKPPEGAKNESKFLLALTALSVLVTPIVVAIITTNANRTSTDKDYVNIAVSILNAKDSPPDNRKWALRVLNKLSPIPFSQKGEDDLAKGSQLYADTIKTQIVKVPIVAPPRILVKRGEKLAEPCMELKDPGHPLDPKEMEALANRLLRALNQCSIKQQYALAVVDILQGTTGDPKRRLAGQSPTAARKKAAPR